MEMKNESYWSLRVFLSGLPEVIMSKQADKKGGADAKKGGADAKKGGDAKKDADKKAPADKKGGKK